MKMFLKWTGFVVAGLVVIVALLASYVHAASERELNRRFAVADITTLAVPTDAESITAGRRIATQAGCMDCHGEKLNGQLVDDIPHLARLVAPNISVVAELA